MDKQLVKMLDGMTGKEVCEYLYALLDNYELEAAEDLKPYLNSLDSVRRVDLHNTHVETLEQELEERWKIIIVHKRELVKLHKIQVIEFYNEILFSLASHIYFTNKDDRDKFKGIDLFIIYSSWKLNSLCSWDQIIEVTTDLLEKFSVMTMGKYREHFENVIKFAKFFKDREAMYDTYQREDVEVPDVKLDKKESKELDEWFRQPIV
ncbi:Uncharacterised protein [Candidatus Bilamarchaeum dharawalense]|uniref:Uncharacterized protein n=1 Tax=Candidatus Bilamarchaeum dharawalense TaxID=2885759 RepID=A0A5E4LN11_9ARCH|nr:Uncharacterised protein [Candidatus Bilamarchaeum dharawalense]